MVASRNAFPASWSDCFLQVPLEPHSQTASTAQRGGQRYSWELIARHFSSWVMSHEYYLEACVFCHLSSLSSLELVRFVRVLGSVCACWICLGVAESFSLRSYESMDLQVSIFSLFHAQQDYPHCFATSTIRLPSTICFAMQWPEPLRQELRYMRLPMIF